MNFEDLTLNVCDSNDLLKNLSARMRGMSLSLGGIFYSYIDVQTIEEENQSKKFTISINSESFHNMPDGAKAFILVAIMSCISTVRASVHLRYPTEKEVGCLLYDNTVDNLDYRVPEAASELICFNSDKFKFYCKGCLISVIELYRTTLMKEHSDNNISGNSRIRLTATLESISEPIRLTESKWLVDMYEECHKLITTDLVKSAYDILERLL